MIHEPYFFLIPEDTAAQGGGGSGGGSGDIQADRRAHNQQDLQSRYQETTDHLLRLCQPKGLSRIELLRKMNLNAPNHLGRASQALGGRPMLKLVFDHVDQLQRVKKEVAEVLRANQRRRADEGEGFDLATYDADHDPGAAVAA